MDTDSKLEEAWTVLPLESYPLNVFDNLVGESPNCDGLRTWLQEQYLLQRSTRDIGTTNSNEDFFSWLVWQERHGELWQLLTIKIPRLTHIVFTQSATKYIMISQRHCHECSRSLKGEDQFPIKMIPLRIDPISWQASSPELKRQYKAKIVERIGNISAEFERTENFCVALTFCLNVASRDRDCDNMAKGVLDAVADAIQVNDRRFVHVDIVKLVFSDCEDSIAVRIAPSGLLKNTDVLVPETRVDYAGWERMELSGRKQSRRD